VLFNGRSAQGILKDALHKFPGEEHILVITRDGDTLPPPPECVPVPVSEFRPDPGSFSLRDGQTIRYVVIANGGTTAQLVTAIRRLLERGCMFGVWDVQRDGVTELWPMMRPDDRAAVIAAGVGEVLASRLTESEARELYKETAW